MRELKFRARHIKNKHWYFGVERDDEADPLLPLGIFWLWIEQGILDRKTLGAYIGLKDRDVKEIYEGDRVRFHSGAMEFIHSVTWKEREALFAVCDGDKWGGFALQDMNDIEVIGNIYEIPSL